MDDMSKKVKEIADLLIESSYAVALTGAGVSTESGVPDFRSPGSGLWTQVNVEIFTIDGFKANPEAFYRAGLPFYRLLEQAQPNEAHLALAELEKRNLIKSIITQNVDGLHQKGGAEKVLEIHGTLSSVSCIYCKKQVAIEQVLADLEEGLLPPLCIECGEPLKPDVVLFGEPLSPDYRDALQEAEKADLILVVGSSMQVSPANQLPAMCDNLVIINNTPTFYDKQARVVINESASLTMQMLQEEIENRSP